VRSPQAHTHLQAGLNTSPDRRYSEVSKRQIKPSAFVLHFLRHSPSAKSENLLYLLSLVLGFSELLILDEIMKQQHFDMGLAELPKAFEFFHLIGDISTGG
jgi:hypothetical protein